MAIFVNWLIVCYSSGMQTGYSWKHRGWHSQRAWASWQPWPGAGMYMYMYILCFWTDENQWSRTSYQCIWVNTAQTSRSLSTPLSSLQLSLPSFSLRKWRMTRSPRSAGNILRRRWGLLGVQSQTATSGNTRCLHRNCKLHEALDSLLGETVFNAFHILKCSVISLVAIVAVLITSVVQ